MAFGDIIDAVTGASFKAPDGSVKEMSLSDLGTNVKQEASQLVEQAKASVLDTVLPPLKQVVDKAIPAALAASATLQYMGGNCSFVDFLNPAYLSSTFLELDRDKHEFVGYPLHSIVMLNTLSGFTLCENVQLDIPGATVEELDIIKRFLESGFIIE